NVSPDLLIVRDGREARMFADIASDAATCVVTVRPGKDADLPTLDSLYESDPSIPEIALSGDDMSIIMHTSGTTSVPKGAIMRHSDLMFNVMTTINAHQFSTCDVHILVNPMFHCTALYSSLPTAAYQKTPVIITSDTKPEGLMELIQTEGITTFLTVPSVLQRIVALPTLDEYDASSLRLVGYAGSPMPVSTIRHLQDHFPDVEGHNFFGLTETTSMTHVLSGEDAMERPDSIGRLLPFVDALIVDEDENAVPAGTVGELLFDRSNVISGYLNQPDKLQAAMTTIDGREWFKTGDLACVDEEGYFFIKGRKKDMIIVGGENVFAAEVEGVLFGHPQVREAAVKGVPATGVRASLGEMIKAYVVPDEAGLTEMDVRKFCHARLPSYKLPHVIEFRDALPRNPAGKVVKAELD
ncbi:MAG: AMP-binding protein, partial [Lentisphaerae bacterium]|nr:AMP-binding protein [Lentisphaerota bacterium]